MLNIFNENTTLSEAENILDFIIYNFQTLILQNYEEIISNVLCYDLCILSKGF